MRLWQWATYVVLLFVVLSLFDGGFRMWLRGDVSVHRLDGKHDSETLIVYLPGLVADGEWSARNLTDTWRDFGDVWLVNPTGDRFKSDQLAMEVARQLERDDHQRVVFIGSSLGAHSALDIMERLSPEKIGSTRFDLLAVCSPSDGVRDIKQPLKSVAWLASVFRFGPVTNMTWGKLYTRAITGKQPRTFAMTYYTDQVNYVRSRPTPDLSWFGGRVLYLAANSDEIVSSSSSSAWVDHSNVLEVNSKHVAYEADPEAWNSAFRDALTRLN